MNTKTIYRIDFHEGTNKFAGTLCDSIELLYKYLEMIRATAPAPGEGYDKTYLEVLVPGEQWVRFRIDIQAESHIVDLLNRYLEAYGLDDLIDGTSRRCDDCGEVACAETGDDYTDDDDKPKWICADCLESFQQNAESFDQEANDMLFEQLATTIKLARICNQMHIHQRGFEFLTKCRNDMRDFKTHLEASKFKASK